MHLYPPSGLFSNLINILRPEPKQTNTKCQHPRGPDFGLYPGYNDLPAVLDPTTLHPVIRDFHKAIEDDPEIYMGFREMFEQIPKTTRYELDMAGIGPQIRNYEHMLYRLNNILQWSPAFGDGGDYSSFPLNTLFAWPMCTTAGFRMFTNAKVNAHLKSILNTWAEFLTSPESRYTLVKEEGGWFSPRAMEVLTDFTENYQCSPDQEYCGFKSWDDFFTRRFKDGARPVDAPADDSVIVNACESTPYAIANNIKERDAFWVKGEPYSIRHILNNDQVSSQFIGGTVFQSYLSAMEYHRWHSPVDGTITKIVSVPGTYYAISTSLAFENSGDPDLAANGYSQAFMSNVAARMLIFIEADNSSIGLMVFVAIGMAEASSCEATVSVGEKVKKGDELGTFHFGGSSYCLAFRAETKIVFCEEVRKSLEKDGPKKPLMVNRRVGAVCPV